MFLLSNQTNNIGKKASIGVYDNSCDSHTYSIKRTEIPLRSVKLRYNDEKDVHLYMLNDVSEVEMQREGWTKITPQTVYNAAVTKWMQ